MYIRTLAKVLNEGLNISPCVLLSGARQVGKSTLCLSLNFEYRVFDDLTQREAAFNDPVGYVALLPKPLVLDEVQKVPEILEGIKIEVDKNRVNGHFLITGSANVLDMKKAKDTLAGRLIEMPMWPLSQKELNHKPDENLIDTLFNNGISSIVSNKIGIEPILNAIINGGYPEIAKIESARGKSLWFNAYISTYVERDIRDIGELRDVSAFIRFFNIISPRSGGLLNKSNLASAANLSESTLSNYLSMLVMIYQISLLPSYSSNVSKRFIKSPKFYLTDSGIFCHILGVATVEALLNSAHKGEIIETFVYSELLKHVSYSETQPKMYHYRTNDKKEIDFVVERADKVFAIEVKSSTTIKKSSFKHIINFQDKSTQKVVGIVLYAGDDILSFGDNQHELYALPLSVFF